MKTTRASSLSYFGVVNSGYNICIWILHFYAPSKAYDIRGWQSSVVLFPEEFRFLFCLLGRRMKYLRRWNGWCNDDNKKLPSVSLTIGVRSNALLSCVWTREYVSLPLAGYRFLRSLQRKGAWKTTVNAARASAPSHAWVKSEVSPILELQSSEMCQWIPSCCSYLKGRIFMKRCRQSWRSQPVCSCSQDIHSNYGMTLQNYIEKLSR